MAKFQIIAAAALQIVGIEDGHAEAGEVLGTIETDCEIGSLISCMNFGQVRVDQIKKAKKSAATDEAVEEDSEAATETEAAATDAPARTTRRRK